LSILGEVFDVSKGVQHYGPGKGYNFFTGKDGTRAFITGEFNKEGLIPEVKGLTPSQMLGIEDWLSFYRKDYNPAGVLIGHFYDEQGNPKPTLLDARAAIEVGKVQKKKRGTA